MKILVCIKQVPGTTQVDIDEKTGVLKRSNTLAKMNPYDLYAIETALQLKEMLPGAQTTALTMGPPQSEAILREAFMMGIDAAVLLTDRKFGGSDCLATAYALSQAIQHIGLPDLILCGKQTTDGDTAQVGAELAELLNLPHAACIRGISHVDAAKLEVVADLGDELQRVSLPLPCLLTVEKGVFEPRLPSYRKKIATQERPIQRLTFADMPDQNSAHYGLDGSPTRVMRIFPPVHDKVNERWQGTPEEMADKLLEKLIEIKAV